MPRRTPPDVAVAGSLAPAATHPHPDDESWLAFEGCAAFVPPDPSTCTPASPPPPRPTLPASLAGVPPPSRATPPSLGTPASTPGSVVQFVLPAVTWIFASMSLSAGPPCPGSLNHATPSSTMPKNSSYMPGVGGAWKSNLNSYVPPGGTVPVTSAARLVDTHVESAKTLARSRGCVVP